jgi:hypothetical protein
MTVVDDRFMFCRGEHCIFCREGNVQRLGSEADEYKCIHGEIKIRPNSGNVLLPFGSEPFTFTLLSKNMKIKIYITVLFLLFCTYGHEMKDEYGIRVCRE